jgi:hypothetical protein
MKLPYRMSGWQLFLICLFSSLCVTPHGFPGLHAKLGRGIWVAPAVQLVLALIAALGVHLLLRFLPGLSLPAIALRLLGPFLGRMYLAALSLYILLWGPLGNHVVLMGMIEAVSLPVTSPILINGAMLLTALLAARFGPEVIARAAEVWAFVLLPVLALLSLVPFANGMPGRLLPLAGAAPGVWTDPEFWAFGLALRGFLLVLVLGGSLKGDESPARPLFGGIAAGAAITGLLVILPHTVFSPEALARLNYPVLESMDTVDASAIGIQSFLQLTMAVWYFLGWLVVSATLWASAHVLGGLLGLASERPLLVPLALVSLAVPAYPVDYHVVDLLRFQWSALGYAVGLGGPWLMVAAASLRRAAGAPPA